MDKRLLKFKNFLKEHYLIMVGSFLLTIIIFAPLIAFPRVAGSQYQGININHFGSDAVLYLTSGKEVLDDNGLGSPFLKEGKNQPEAHFSYSEFILLAPIKLLGLRQKLGIVTIYNTENFIGIFFLILLIYLFAWQLSGNKLLSIASALFVIGGYSIVYNKSLFYGDFNVYARLIYPYFSSLILFLYLNFLVKSLKSNELRFKIFAGLAFGLLFYIYFYAWSFALALNGCLFLIYLLKKDFLSLKKVLLISFIGLALGAYNLISLVLFMGSLIGKQAAYFNYMSYGYAPIFSKIGFITLIIFVVYYYKRRDDKNWPILLAIILAGWVTLNQQIISGKLLQYGHYYWYFIVPLSIIASFYMVWQLIKNESFKKYLFIFLIAVVFINTAGGQYKSFFTTLERKKYEQNYRPLIDFLNNEKTPSVILSGDDLSDYLFTIYTPHDLFWHSAASLNRTPIQRFKDALFVYLYLNKESRNDFKGYLTKIADNQADWSFYQSLYRNLEGYWSGYSYYDYTNKIATDYQGFSQKRLELIDQLSKEYEQTVLENNGINELLKKYSVNYIVWDKNINPGWNLNGIQGLKPVVASNNIYLYKLN